MNHRKLTDVDSLLEPQSDDIKRPKEKTIETQLIDYVMFLRNDGVGYATIHSLITPIFTFYLLNDVVLNRKKVQRYLGEYKRIVKDKAYTSEQLQTALQSADARMRMIILILSSSGCRIGALPALTLGNLTIIKDYGLYKVTFYEGTNNEYYSFTTRECAQTGIDSYLSYRQRCGEKLSFNQNTNRWEPEDTLLIRQSFDMNDSLQASRRIKPISLHGLRMALDIHLIRCGIRQPAHPTEHNKRVRKPIALANGFRKHVISTFIEAGLNHEIRELLVDHATHLDQNYFRPTEEQVLNEYLKAESLLTIDPSLRLQNEIQTLKVEKSNWQALRQELDELKEMFNTKPKE
jgi:integrase